jgi:6-phosphofructokinase 2
MECRRAGVSCILDSTNQWLAEGISAKPYLIKPNIHEAETLLKIDLSTEEAIIKAARKLVRKGIEIVVISRGKDGIIAATKEKIIKAVPPPVKVRSAVGAGDCTIAGLALKLANDEPLIEACRLGVAMGAATVLTPGTELCHKEDVEMLLPQVQLWEIPANLRRKKLFPPLNENASPA